MRTLDVAAAAREMYKKSTSRKNEPKKTTPENLSVSDNFELTDFDAAFACGCLLLEVKTRFGLVRSWTTWLTNVAGIPVTAARTRMKRAREALGITLSANAGVFRRRNISKAVATEVYERDRWVCYLCGEQTLQELFGKNDIRAPRLDHVIPAADGGDPTPDNLRCACDRCNRKKADKGSQIIEIILSEALYNCFWYYRENVGPVPAYKSNASISDTDLQLLWRQYVLTEWEDDYEKESTALNDTVVQRALMNFDDPLFPPDDWLEKAAKFVRDFFDGLPGRKWPPEGLAIEVRISDEGRGVLVEKKKLVPRKDGFGGNRIEWERERLSYQDLATRDFDKPKS
ncbi:MAG: hypothetical protein DHS20C05_13720 [Hyphococcus sp.]|nr:MAG: hypothetical protein DHS20C05_13720 [Marinicaulis sp.]